MKDMERIVVFEKGFSPSLWGSSIQWTDADWSTGRVHGWCEPRPRDGDILRVAFKNGKVLLARFTKVELMRDPPDMFFAQLVFLGGEGEAPFVRGWWDRLLRIFFTPRPLPVLGQEHGKTRADPPITRG